MSPLSQSLECEVTRPAVSVLQAHHEDAWRKFVADHPDGNVYHTLEWRSVIVEVFQHRPEYLVAFRGDVLTGVLPMFQVQAPFLGSKLISLPYDVGSGGPLASDAMSAQALAEEAVRIARERQVNYLEFRSGRMQRGLEGGPLECQESVIISEMALGSANEVWERVSDNHQRSLRTAQRRGVEVRRATTVSDYEAFYRIYVRCFRNLGSPSYDWRYFPAVRRHLSDRGDVHLLLAEAGGEPIGGLLALGGKKMLIAKVAAVLPEALKLRTYPALYWATIELGVQIGAGRLSWGTSSRSQIGLIEFKERWGAHSRPARLYQMPVKKKIPDLERYYDDSGIARRVWRRLPVWSTAALGGVINRWFC